MKLCKDLTILNKIQSGEIHRAYGQIDGFSYKERHDCRCSTVNQVSRAKIRAMRPCYIIRVNLYDDHRKKKDFIATEYTSGRVYNFAGSFVIRERDEQLIDLIHARDCAPYTGTFDDSQRVEAIYNRMEEFKGEILSWT